ncbi:hypothetical protein KAW80_04180 [Candidatus Babeliales bacterium]|nr:hypothetical protein [Candidatus Babeliales bacterium]
MPHKIPFRGILLLFPLLLICLSNLAAHKGNSVSLFDHVILRSYELTADGADSYVLELSGIKGLYEEIGKSKQPVVVKFFYPHSTNTQKTALLFQDIAECFKNKVKFSSVDILRNKDMVRFFGAFFLKLAIGLQSQKDQSTVVFLPKIMEFLKRLVALEKVDNSIPFVLFFKNGSLIFPHSLDFLDKAKFISAVEGQLLSGNKQHVIRLFDIKKEAVAKKESIWKRVKKRVRNWWKREKN